MHVILSESLSTLASLYFCLYIEKYVIFIYIYIEYHSYKHLLNSFNTTGNMINFIKSSYLSANESL